MQITHKYGTQWKSVLSVWYVIQVMLSARTRCGVLTANIFEFIVSFREAQLEFSQGHPLV